MPKLTRTVSWKRVAQALVALLPTANAVLLTIQASLAEPGVSGVIHPWVYADVNGAVIVGTLITKVIAQLMAAPVIVRWLTRYWPQLLESVDASTDSAPPPTD